MSSQHAPSSGQAVTCSRCRQPAHVPFTPTPGRPVYCRACFAKRSATYDRGPHAPPVRAPPARRMLSQRRKGHFVHDALAELDRSDAMEEAQRRAFVEMVFTRGARQTSQAAQEFLREKAQEDVLPQETAERLAGLVERYSARQ